MKTDDQEAAAHRTAGGGGAITQLAELPPHALVDEQFLADAFGVTPRTVRRMVARHEIPPPLSIGNRAIWVVGRVLDYLDGRAKKAQREAEKEAERIDKYT